jgi:folate-binding protein YgfZ
MTGSSFVTLPGRAVVRVAGDDRFTFLQGLVSNDVTLLQNAPVGTLFYSCLLNAQGKFLHDFFMSAESDSILLECEGGARAQDMARRFAMYKLRAAIKVSVEDSVPVYAVLPPADGAGADPRHSGLGLRQFAKPAGEEKPFEHWDRLRITLNVPDGSRDMKVEDSSLIECGIDNLHGISFSKGCYVGQELTARMKHRGLAKKHLFALKFEDAAPASGTEFSIDGKFAGEMRSSCGDVGLALLKNEYAARAEEIGASLIGPSFI